MLPGGWYLKTARIAVLALLLAACRVGGTTPTVQVTTTIASPSTSGVDTTTSAPGGMEVLLAAARSEGTLITIGLPREYCNYGGVIEGFEAKYGIDVNELAPDAAPADVLEAIRGNQDGGFSLAPDVIDIGLTLGPQAKAEGLIKAYKVETWDSIPEHAKDPDGSWYGGYYGVMAFEVNSNVVPVVPTGWSDLLDPQYNGQVALAGDPRVSNQAVFTVYSASLANGGSLDDAQPGLDYFAHLNEVGNLAPVIAESATVASGQTPITIRWTYNALPNRDANAGLEVVVPDAGLLAGVYVQAISAFAPHPNAARLWMEYLYSDEGQLAWLEGHCHPIRYDDLVANDAVLPDLAARVPDLTGTAFPSPDQAGVARELITANWDAVVGLEVGG
jgi:putative spermidine/putrescine transport system substrate-binding protein